MWFMFPMRMGCLGWIFIPLMIPLLMCVAVCFGLFKWLQWSPRIWHAHWLLGLLWNGLPVALCVVAIGNSPTY